MILSHYGNRATLACAGSRARRRGHRAGCHTDDPREGLWRSRWSTQRRHAGRPYRLRASDSAEPDPGTTRHRYIRWTNRFDRLTE